MYLIQSYKMADNKFEFSYSAYNDSSELNEADARLLDEARKVTEDAYAPYSNFHVGAVALLENGQKVAGTNGLLVIFSCNTCPPRER